MSDPLRTDLSRAHDDASAVDRDAKIEQLLLVGLDHYFAARYELAINVWTRALFLDRSHARARAYIDRARSALAERQRESEELLQNGVAAFDRGEGSEARRLLQAAIDRGAPSEEALAVLDRLNRLENAAAPPSPPTGRTVHGRLPRAGVGPTASAGGAMAVAALAFAVVGLAGWATWTRRVDWRALVVVAQSLVRTDAPIAKNVPPVVRDAPLPLPRRGEEMLTRARSLDRLRGDIQRQLLALTVLPTPPSPDREKGQRRNP
jgi:tetratricopeptide (TPR) repeat protein